MSIRVKTQRVIKKHGLICPACRQRMVCPTCGYYRKVAAPMDNEIRRVIKKYGWTCPACGSEKIDITNVIHAGRWRVYATCESCKKGLVITKRGIGALKR